MHFFELEAGEKFRAEFTDEVAWESIKCPIYDGHQRPGNRRTDMYVVLPSDKVPHFIRTWFSDLIITDEVANLFKEERFTGFTLKPVIVRKVKRGNLKEVPKLWEMIITGKGGEAHPKSEIRLKKECKACNSKVYTGFGNGLFVDEAQWDGSDFFTIWPLPKYILVSERVKEFIKKNKFKHCKLTSVEKLIGKGEEGTLSPC